ERSSLRSASTAPSERLLGAAEGCGLWSTDMAEGIEDRARQARISAKSRQEREGSPAADGRAKDRRCAAPQRVCNGTHRSIRKTTTRAPIRHGARIRGYVVTSTENTYAGPAPSRGSDMPLVPS